jgi:hypothetical protein
LASEYLQYELVMNLFLAGAESFELEGLLCFQYNKGFAALASHSGVLNKALMADSSHAKMIAKFIMDLNSPRILFNEYYHGYDYSGNYWQQLPLHYKALSIQLALTVLALMLYKGSRLGKPIPLHEEIERDENEYHKALANLYRKAGMGSIVYDDLSQAFLNKCSKAFHAGGGLTKDSLVKLWKLHGLPCEKSLAQAFPDDAIFNTRVRRGRIKLMACVSAFRVLEKALDKSSKKKGASIYLDYRDIPEA